MTFAQRFWSKVDPAPSECCWEWTASKDKDGYGKFSLNYQTVKAHRFVYHLTKGEIPVGLMVRHTCDNPACCNPNHLILGTPADNMADKVERNRQAKGEQHYGSKLTTAQVIEIYNSSLSTRKLAKLYNISSRHVSNIKRKQNWKHIHS